MNNVPTANNKFFFRYHNYTAFLYRLPFFIYVGYLPNDVLNTETMFYSPERNDCANNNKNTRTVEAPNIQWKTCCIHFRRNFIKYNNMIYDGFLAQEKSKKPKILK